MAVGKATIKTNKNLGRCLQYIAFYRANFVKIQSYHESIRKTPTIQHRNEPTTQANSFHLYLNELELIQWLVFVVKRQDDGETIPQ